MQSKNILIVDDIIVNRILLIEIIKELNHTYLEAKNGKEALEVLEKNAIDIILMDIEMPVMNGIETTKKIRNHANEKLKNIPVIALTAHNPSDFFQNHIDVGFNDLICKPYLIDKIAHTIAKFN